MKRKALYLSMLLACMLISGQAQSQRPTKTESILSTGTWHKMAVENPGLYKLDYAIVDEMGLAGSKGSALRIFGDRGGSLPQIVSAERIDDLEEIATLRSGLDDGSFDPGDFILFYAEGPDKWTYDPVSERFRFSKNIYDLENHYFAGIIDGTPKEISARDNITVQTTPISTFDDFQRLEDDRINLLGKFRPPGSGKKWYGDEFSAVQSRQYAMNFPNIVPSVPAKFTIEFAGRCGSASTVFATLNGNEFSASLSKVDLGDVEDDYARIASLNGSYLPGNALQTVELRYPQVPGTTTAGWLDYIDIQVVRSLEMYGTSMYFRSISSAQGAEAVFELGNVAPQITIWDVTDPFNVELQQHELKSDQATFGFITDGEIREFVAFDASQNFPVPVLTGPVTNQNIHSVASADLVIVYHRDFEDQAMMLAEHRQSYSNLSVLAVPVDQVYNEFSGGSVDPTAIRDLAAMLKARSDDFRYLLLFGDGSYDIRHLNKDQPDDNFIPVYETNESMDPIRSFPSDDYFALLDDNEGADNLIGALDIAVGRITVATPTEAQAVVNKIIHYDNGPGTFGDWRLRLMYVGDDEDGNLHLNQSELIAGSVEAENERYNINKVYLDAYPQESTAGGPRYPDANNAINSGVQKGSLVVNYLGHGGHLGWSQERVLTLNDIQGWTNLDRLPVFVTATCSFTGYDEPSYKSAGEQVLLNPGGGAVALLTTVRAVYSSSNKRLASAVFDSFFVQQNGEYHALGEIVRLAKNSNPIDTSDINARKFSVIGDPSMIVAYPRHSVALTHINGSATGGIPDTLRALDKVELKGEIRDSDSALLQDFNGRLSLTVFDKPVKTQTLANDPNSFQREFSSLSRIVFKGFATVRDGKFTISFVVPEDISFAYGQGKISMYATDELTTDAAGFYNDFVIGGTSGNIDADNSGPEVELYLNNTSFKSGDIVGPNPLMLVHLEDESGINIIGNSIGHDLEAVLDGDTRNTIVLNDFYEASQDDYTRGEVRYPLYGLEPGRHTLSVTAWDVAGNFSEASIEFYVESDPDNPIRKVWNYPNPFDYSSGTTFRIEHDLVIASADVEIDVFDISGRHVSQFTQAGVPSANGIIEITGWNESAQALGNGIFFYRIGLTANQGSSSTRSYSSAYGKLILVN